MSTMGMLQRIAVAQNELAETPFVSTVARLGLESRKQTP